MFSLSDDITNLDGYAFHICNPAYLQISVKKNGKSDN